MIRRTRPHRRSLCPSNRSLAEKLPERTEPFQSEDALLEGAIYLFSSRENLFKYGDNENIGELEETAEKWEEHWHEAFDMTDDGLPFCARCHDLGLCRIEREILVILILERLGILDHRIGDCGDVIEALGLPGTEAIEAVRAMSENGKLAGEGLIFFDDPDEDPCERQISVDPLLLEYFVSGEEQGKSWPVETEEQLYEKLNGLTQLLSRKNDYMEFRNRGRTTESNIFKVNRRITSVHQRLFATLKEHTNWGLSHLLSALNCGDLSGARKNKKQKVNILLALLGKELGHQYDADSLFKGKGLASVANMKNTSIKHQLDLLRPDSELLESVSS